MDQLCYEPSIAYSRRELAWYIHSARAFTLVAESGEDEPRIGGFLIASDNGRGIGHVITVDVLPQERRTGLASALMREAERRLQQAGCDRIRLEAAVDNGGALAFYRRFGYTVVRTLPRYYSNGLDALVLEKLLEGPGDRVIGPSGDRPAAQRRSEPS